VALYDQLAALRPEPIVLLNRAVALAERDGPSAGLTALDTLDDGRLADYQPFHAARADLLARAGRRDDALAAYDRAIALTTNPVEAEFLRRRRATVSAAP
jgi:RNA polymerase sigma-70 factor (ECF subfamily)